MNITVLAIGKKRSEYDSAIQTYAKRIVAPFALNLEVLEPLGHDNSLLCRMEESKRLLSRLKSDDLVIVLDERGRDKSTVEFAAILDQQLQNSVKRLVFIIGGAYGFEDTIRARANLILRLSALTLPHELARLILVEQLYRTTNLLSGGKYHHT